MTFIHAVIYGSFEGICGIGVRGLVANELKALVGILVIIRT